jgi:hypothetical protein
MKARICNQCGTVVSEVNVATRPPFHCEECKDDFYEFETEEVDTENMKHGYSYSHTRHMGVDIQGLLNNYRRKKMTGLMTDDDGRELSDKECRAYLAECQSKGWKVLPMCSSEDCPDFDYFGGGCKGHLKKVTKTDVI